MTLDVGTLVGNFEIRGKIATGGFGTVYRAAQRDAGPEVALKVLHADLVTNLEATRRFEREIRVVQLIRHPNIVDILEVGALPSGEPFFAMELLSGETLAAHIADGGRLSPMETLEILRPLCSALETSHKKGVIHRDLKASNVFLGDRVVLLDFGIAKLVEETGSKITSSRHVIGTPVSMAPEQILAAPIDRRTDVYGLAALAYLMLTAKPPFSSPNAVVLQEMQLYKFARPPSELAPCPASLDPVILGALAKSPGDRPATAAAFLAAIERALEEPKETQAPDESLTAVFVDLRETIDLETADDEVLAQLDDLLPRLCAGLGDDFELVRSAGNSRLFVTRDLNPEQALARIREHLGEYDANSASIAVHATHGNRQRLLDASWVPTQSDAGFFAI